MTDEHNAYPKIADHFRGHGTTAHSAGRYVNLTDHRLHSNTVEAYFSIFKHGMNCVYQHCGEQHLHRHLAESQFRYDYRIANGVGDRQRTVEGLKGIASKRIIYRLPDVEAYGMNGAGKGFTTGGG